MAARKYPRIFCEHCSCTLSKSTWYDHHNKFHGEKEIKDDSSNTEDDIESTTTSSDDDKGECTLSSEVDFSDTDIDSVNADAENSYDLSYDCIQSIGASLSDEESDGDQDDESDGTEIIESSDDDTAVDSQSQSKSEHLSIVKVIVGFLLLWQSVFKVANVAVETLLKFLHVIFKQQTQLAPLTNDLPNSLLKAHQLLNLDRDDFQKLVVCKRCVSTYKYEECFDSHCNVKLCNYVRFPNHPWVSKRKPCSFPLMKSVKTTNGKDRFLPHKLYCYQSIVQALRNLVNSENFFDNCFSWRKRCFQENTLFDIYDGKIWREFRGVDKQNFFFSDGLNLGFLLNVDWYQPFKFTAYSVGVIFLAILNLPREHRYKPENIILCGIIPGPHEPELTINSFLEPLVEDLQLLWRGVSMKCGNNDMLVKAALICVSCDTPAARKTGGFVGHASLKGCFKCLKSFVTVKFGEKPDYSGFDRSKWPIRTNDSHREAALKFKHAKTYAAQCQVEKEEGVRFGELVRLPYFDSVNFFAVDPMHNLLLGTAKRVLCIWKKLEVLTSEKFSCIQALVDRFVTPSDIGRIPMRIESGFSGFTADQWKHWVLVYSLVCMKNYLKTDDYLCWQNYVAAVSIFCSRTITTASVELADKMIHKFCCMFEDLYGKEECTPNLHLHCHLSESILNFGPAPTFWLFSFERLNGILGSYHNNRHSIELQLMRKFITSQQINRYKFPETQTSEECKLILLGMHKVTGSTQQAFVTQSCDQQCKFISPIKQKVFNSTTLTSVSELVHRCYGMLKVLMIHKEFPGVIVNGELYGTQGSRMASNSLAMVRFSCDIMPCFIQNFFEISTKPLDDSVACCEKLLIASVIKLNAHNNRMHYGSPIEVWQHNYEDDRIIYVPLQDVLCRCAYLTISNSDNVGLAPSTVDNVVIVICPINYCKSVDML